MTKIAARFLQVFVGLGLAACSSSGLTTGSVTGLTKQAEPVSDLTARTLQVASTSARARKCGYHFDPVRLRAGFLAAEAQAGTPPPEIAKAEKAYDVVVARVSAGAADAADYCTDAMTTLVKADLGRHLAGDYSPRVTRASAEPPPSSKAAEPLDRSRAFDPTGVRTPRGGTD